MREDQKYPEWFLWFMEHGVRVLILLAIAFMAFVYSRSRTNDHCHKGNQECPSPMFLGGREDETFTPS